MKIADIGCGTGASTILLAKELDAEITAVDFLTEFLDELQSRAKDHGVADRITTLNCSMDALPFTVGEFDVIWSEGAIYNMGFEAGVSAWSRFPEARGKAHRFRNYVALRSETAGAPVPLGERVPGG